MGSRVISFISLSTIAVLTASLLSSIAFADPIINEYSLPTNNSQPMGISNGPDGNVWFTELHTNKIAKMTPSGAVTEYPLPAQSSSPEGITAGADGNLWFIDYSSAAYKISKITTSGVITEYPVPSTSSSTHGLTAGPDGNIWFTDSSNNKIGKITTSGAITEYSLPFAYHALPYSITTGPDGALWFTCANSFGNDQLTENKIGRITINGSITEYPTPSHNENPEGITTGPDGALWFTESNVNKIGRVTTTGNFTEYPVPTPSSSVDTITLGPDAALWFTENGGNKVGRIDTSGNISEYTPPSSGNGAYGITSGSDGGLWFAEFNVNKIGHISLTLSAPTNLTAPTPTTSDPALTWDTVTGATSYNIYRDGNKIDTSTTNSFTDTTATNATHAYYVTAVNSAGESSPSNTISVTVNRNTLVQAINAGGNTSGNYATDTNFTGGQTYTTADAVDTSNVNNPAPQDVYQSVRYGTNMSYTFSGLTPNADYTLRLHFNELYWGTSNANDNGGVGSRVFDVVTNGVPSLTNFDIYSAAGGADKAIVKQVHTTADSNGNVTVTFYADTDNAMVSGLELYNGTLPAEQTPPTVTSAYVNAGGNATGNYTTDIGFNGGTAFSSTAGVDTSNVTNPAPEAVYQSARYGNFSYVIPNLTPNTNFTVRLHFNELYWGTDLASGNGGTGSRLFNVDINGNQVLNNFDIIQTAGGANKALTESFNAVSDSDGHITIQFTSVTDNALVSGIDVVQQ